MFEYHLANPVTIRRNESALVPILQTDIHAERVTLWNPGLGTRPLRAVWLTNSSGLTLDAGTVSIVDAGAFAGEGLLATVKPGERRLLDRYIGQLDIQETRLDTLNNELRNLTTARDSLQRELAELIRSLTLDVAF
jgi:hypothetical protein